MLVDVNFLNIYMAIYLPSSTNEKLPFLMDGGHNNPEFRAVSLQIYFTSITR